MTGFFIQVFVPGPFSGPLTYTSPSTIEAGCRVQVALGHREVIGIVAGPGQASDHHDPAKPITACLDEMPILDMPIMALTEFAARYYFAAPGDLLLGALPKPLRAGKPRPKPLTIEGQGLTSGVHRTDAQHLACQAITDALGSFQPFLLQGVTGSGKTQVFIDLMHAVIGRQQQILLLIPEIGLTGRIAERIGEQLSGHYQIMHSGRTPVERARAFMAARDGLCDVLIGTRSCLLTPLPRLGLILIDEEHDSSYKNLDGPRYSARDLAVMRAKQASCPVILASATPALETWERANQGHYQRLRLPARASGIDPPQLSLIDARTDRPVDGLTQAARHAIERTLARDEQALVFLNRRGYAPVLYCADCGWSPMCKHCDSKPAVHHHPHTLWCHHCDARQAIPRQCPSCGHPELLRLGEGTERLADRLTQLFPSTPVIRVDRDSTVRKRAFETLLEPVIAGTPCILVGTQMLAKGHDFDRLTTVIVADADQGLLGTDFRSIEHFSQLLTQVSGRAGRRDIQGNVLIQTHRPDSPWFPLILSQDYDALADAMLAERQHMGWPPATHLAVIRARGSDAESTLQALAPIARKLRLEGVNVLGPAPAPMERRNRQFHGQCVVVGERNQLHRALQATGPWLYRRTGKVLIQLDVDPWDLW
jgi:primosomal protein N' (replication factor Y) (superfamily II helicase)